MPSRRPPPTSHGSALEALLTWLQDNPSRDLTLADIVAQAGISIRTLIRRFREQTEVTSLQRLHRARIRPTRPSADSTASQDRRNRPTDRFEGTVAGGTAGARCRVAGAGGAVLLDRWRPFAQRTGPGRGTRRRWGLAAARPGRRAHPSGHRRPRCPVQ
ncbi:helix-turn-helix transcriptional regulator [Streptomyces sp. NPDC005181]|uniref:helix-turn-helix transcriptional regulator n=1 Tax=Streptomyces sp. NPDC005181 TaxID=3156869 RepID=UPI0033A8D5B7